MTALNLVRQTPKKFKTTSHHESIQHESANHKESNLLHFNVIFTDGSDRLQDLFYATQLSSGNIPLTSTSGRCASLVSEGFENSDPSQHLQNQTTHQLNTPIVARQKIRPPEALFLHVTGI
ncbi:hypothetical protein BDDG_13104 [Blastomyces dermatitidis ATCC 18188]|uniref:Uncharacterized protein n=1 Tax=Ajellomyces dermatitidis (strain ATCC 18188 / CBS 674.68) TaxID=653446 RepID=A0A0J9ERE8_AJEDA|nr:hypothetical protein BDDG_13104 [Blastomyces dermatitidis ATCC 18188]